MHSEKRVYGIDLGTTNSCLARYINGTFEVMEIDGEPTVPSVVAFDGARWMVGKEAKNYGKVVPGNAVFSIKRRMGEASYRCSLGQSEYSATEISAKILEHLKRRAFEIHGETVEDVVITVPAWFNDEQRRNTLAAGKIAGLHVMQIINEPTAAALAYEMTDIGCVGGDVHAQKWLVYDLGGGTFDVSVVSVRDGYKEVMASCGNTYLGGDDFDRAIANEITAYLADRHNIDVVQDAVAMAKLKHMAEDCKIALSSQVEVELHDFIPFNDKNYEIDFTLSRERFEEMISSYLESTLHKADQVLQEAHIQANQIDELILVGGSTRIPVVARLLKERYDLDGNAYVDVDKSVALGASVQAAVSAGLTYSKIVVDVAPHTLGVAALGDLDCQAGMMHLFNFGPNKDRHDHPLTFSPMIRKNSKLPARFVNEFMTSVENQKRVEVAVFQGESASTRDNLFIGSFMADLTPKPIHSKIQIGFEYDLNGMIAIYVTEPGSKAPVKRYSMNLNQSSDLNSEPRIFSPVVDDFDDDDYLELEDMEPSSLDEESIFNLLVERVENRLATDDASDHTPVRELLVEYKKALKKEDDAVLDDLEEKLYSWLEDGNKPDGVALV